MVAVRNSVARKAQRLLLKPQKLLQDDRRIQESAGRHATEWRNRIQAIRTLQSWHLFQCGTMAWLHRSIGGYWWRRPNVSTQLWSAIVHLRARYPVSARVPHAKPALCRRLLFKAARAISTRHGVVLQHFCSVDWDWPRDKSGSYLGECAVV